MTNGLGRPRCRAGPYRECIDLYYKCTRQYKHNMMQGIGNAQTRRAYTLISALNAREITVDEFADALQAMPSEVLQIISTVISLDGANEPAQRNLTRARLLCAALATVTRPLN